MDAITIPGELDLCPEEVQRRVGGSPRSRTGSSVLHQRLASLLELPAADDDPPADTHPDDARLAGAVIVRLENGATPCVIGRWMTWTLQRTTAALGELDQRLALCGLRLYADPDGALRIADRVRLRRRPDTVPGDLLVRLDHPRYLHALAHLVRGDRCYADDGGDPQPLIDLGVTHDPAARPSRPHAALAVAFAAVAQDRPERPALLAIDPQGAAPGRHRCRSADSAANLPGTSDLQHFGDNTPYPRNRRRIAAVAARTAAVRPTLAELAEDWLAAKRALESAAQAEKGNSDRARRGDLERWGMLLGGAPRDGDPASALTGLGLRDLHLEAMIGAIGAAKARWSDATVARMLSTLRGFTRWLTRTGHLAIDPLDDDLLRAPPRPERRPKAFSDEAVERLFDEAGNPAEGRRRIWWPTRDVALVRFLATTGARAEEVCAVRIGDLDRRAERPIWRVQTAKGGKTRNVPLPRRTVTALDAWLAERTEPAPNRPAFPARRADPLFVRTNGSPLSEQALDRIVRGLAERAEVVLPTGAAAHAFRHHYGVTLALRGVPSNVISQLMGHADPRTTAIYTTVAATHLIAALDDAGLL